MENQVTQLKLNVTNIKSSLFSSNKQLKKLKTDKKNLFFKLEKKKELRAEETRLETPRLGIGSGFSKIMSAVTSPVRSIFDRILDFIGLIAAGILINNLPIIIEKIQEFFNSDFIKGVGNVLGIIGNAILGLAKFVGIFPKSEQDKIEKNIKETDKRFDENIKDADAAEKDVVNLEKFLGQTDSGIDEAPIESDSSTPESISEISEPPPKETFSPSSSNTESNTKEITASKPAQSFNSGGTVKSEGPSLTPSLAQKQTYTPQKSGVSKKVQRDTNDGFTKFPIAVDNIHKSTKEQEKNIIAFSKMLKYSRGNDIIGTNNTNTNNNNTNNNNTNNNNTNNNNTNNNNANNNNANATGLTSEDIDGSGEPGYDFTPPGGNNLALFDGVVVKDPLGTNNQISGNRGYGNFMIIRHEDPNRPGSYFDALYAHFPNKNFKKPGETVKKGEILGRMGTLNDPFDQRGSITGTHMSVDFYPVDGPYRKPYSYPYWDKLGSHINPKTLNGKSSSSVTPLTGNKGGGDLRLNRSMNNQSVFIYAIQPQETFVPFPYPMPIETPAPSSSSTPQLSAIWRT